MKKFLIFLVATITAICIGMTFYQFAKNDEVIKVTNQVIYVNYGDKLSLDNIGFSRKDANKDTKINFNAGGDEVTSIIKYDEVTQSYVPTQKGGATTIKISTTNRKYKTLTIDVIVGVGSKENPYYISNEEQLFNIGNVYQLDASYELVCDIDVKLSHLPIGLVDGSYNEFDGDFNGNYHSISNLKIDSCDNAGLFAIMGANSSVYNLNLTNSTFDGSFLNVGTVAGICYGSINKVVVANSNITNTRNSGNTGAVVGSLLTDKTAEGTASMLRTSAYTDQNSSITAKSNLGGLAGSVDSAIVHACYSNVNLINEYGITGGLVGLLTVDDNTYIRESYSISQIKSKGTSGNIVGKVAISNLANSINQELVLVGLYFDKTLNSYKGVGADPYSFATITNFAISGKTPEELKTKTTYIYYINSNNEIIYWDKVWSLVDGEYPSLTFISNFDDIVLEDDSVTTNPDNQNPDNQKPDISNPDISGPDSPSLNASTISTKQELINVFQKTEKVAGEYVISNSIDLEGIAWTPVKFSGSLIGDESKTITISNFKINSSALYSGFFSTLSSATIKNIQFENVTISNAVINETTGVLVGYITSSTKIENVTISNCKITATSKYAGGLVGYIGSAVVEIRNCLIEQSSIGTSTLNIGGLAGYIGANSTISNSIVNDTNLVAIDRIGGLIAVNYGSVANCTASGAIKSSSIASAAGYFGGICAVNRNKILNCSTSMSVSVLNNSDKTKNIFYYVGGLCGYNTGIISKSSSFAESISGNNATSATHLGGLTGYNTGSLEYCLASIKTLGEVRANIYSSGLSAYNYGGNIYGCSALIDDIKGYVVAGLIRVNSNNGKVDSCISSSSSILQRAKYLGLHTVAFVYDMSSGTISNCLVSADLSCQYDTGWMAGFAGFMPYTNGTFGTITDSISNVSFGGKGIKYLDLAQDGLMKKERTTGTIKNSVLSKDAMVEGVILSDYDNDFLFWGTATPGSGSNYIVANAKEMANIETYLDTKKCNLDIIAGDLDSKWLYVNSYPTPIPRATIKSFSSVIE